MLFYISLLLKFINIYFILKIFLDCQNCFNISPELNISRAIFWFKNKLIRAVKLRKFAITGNEVWFAFLHSNAYRQCIICFGSCLYFANWLLEMRLVNYKLWYAETNTFLSWFDSLNCFEALTHKIYIKDNSGLNIIAYLIILESLEN